MQELFVEDNAGAIVEGEAGCQSRGSQSRAFPSKKGLTRLFERYYKARKAKAYETIIRSGANLPKITTLVSANTTSL
jgi:hypothetical protein